MSPLEETRKIGSRVLRKGEVIKIDGQGAAEFSIVGFRDETVEVYGGKPGRAMFRAFSIDRIGARPRSPKLRTSARQKAVGE